MKVIINSENITKIAVFLLAIFCFAALHHAKAAAAQIAVEANDSLSDAGNRALNQRKINADPDNIGAGYLLAQAEAVKQMPASKLALYRTRGDVNNIAIQGNWIYYSNIRDSGKLYAIKTDGSGRQKLNDE